MLIYAEVSSASRHLAGEWTPCKTVTLLTFGDQVMLYNVSKCFRIACRPSMITGVSAVVRMEDVGDCAQCECSKNGSSALRAAQCGVGQLLEFYDRCFLLHHSIDLLLWEWSYAPGSK